MSYMLESNELIIENVLKFLSWKSLKELMLVNSLWYSAAERLLRKRKDPSFLHWNDKDNNSNAEECYSHFLDDIYAIPETVITFSSKSTEIVPCSCGEGKRRKLLRLNSDVRLDFKPDFDAFLRRKLEVEIKNVQVTSYSVVGVDNSDDKNPVMPKHITSSATSSIFWPKRNDLTIKVATSYDDLRRDFPSENDGKRLKLILVLCHHTEDIDEEIWQVECLVAGCKVTSLKYNGNICPMIGITFFGRNNIQVASVVVKQNENNQELVEKRLMEFFPFLRKKFCADQTMDSNFDVQEFAHRMQCYLLACVDRMPVQKRKNVDLASFAKIFPGVPLFGMSGYGEIGMDVTCESSLQKFYEGNNGFVMKDNLYIVSSVFVMITF